MISTIKIKLKKEVLLINFLLFYIVVFFSDIIVYVKFNKRKFYWGGGEGKCQKTPSLVKKENLQILRHTFILLLQNPLLNKNNLLFFVFIPVLAACMMSRPQQQGKQSN